ncbi:MAG: hypothetical protein JKY49_08195 [Cohaesibacteraceae bacterium]|nr:hypothetical protein [Cohaesibacteraceae bacterium]
MRTFVTSWLSSNSDNGAWRAHHLLRYCVFRNRMDYDVPDADAMEFDQFDTPRARYVVVMLGDEALACCRLISFSDDIMVRTLWPEMLGSLTIDCVGTLEATRIAVSKNHSAVLRGQALELLVGMVLDYAKNNSFHSVVGVMPTLLFKLALERRGCSITYPGPEQDIDGILTRAGVIDVAGSIERRSFD